MGDSLVKQEFYKWIISLDQLTLSDTDKKFLNLLITNFDDIVPLGTAGGSRAKKIGQLIVKHKTDLSSMLIDLASTSTADTEIVNYISELKIGPFRGFSVEETFTFDKKYTFMYGPNGSGKSSFCEGLEYALLGSISEAESKRIDVALYTKNAKVGTGKNPTIYGIKKDKQKVMIAQNPTAYRFSFIEKNRIDNFARISSATAKNQQDRIATLFGLDDFNEFVNNFTENFDGKYLTLVNQKELDFAVEIQENAVSKARIVEINKGLSNQAEKVTTLLNEVGQEKIKTLEELNLYLIGDNGTKGVVNSLQEKKAESVPIDINKLIIGNLSTSVRKLGERFALLKLKILDLENLSSEVNFKDLYMAIELISKDIDSDKSVCPACKTPIDKAVIDPFTNAVSELGKVGHLATIQSDIESIAISISKEIRDLNNTIKELNKIKEVVANKEPVFSLLTEFVYTGIVSIGVWKNTFTIELNQVQITAAENTMVSRDIQSYNTTLQQKRDEKAKINKELLKYQNFKQHLDETNALRTTWSNEKTNLEKKVIDFKIKNIEKLKEIEKLKDAIDVHKEYVSSYQSLIGKLKEYRNALPLILAAGLADRTKEFFNIINDHDSDFEKLEYLKLPTGPGEKIFIRFYGDTKEYDALLILSEGHIKILGLSLLLSKVVNGDLGFIIFDDIVNAIDDEHRDGIAELLLKNPDLKDRQHILTCHGAQFISKLEHKIGASTASKEIKSYRFVPSDVIEERGVKISNGSSKHYLLLAKKSFEEDDRKDVASRCRQAIESISEQLWNKLCKKLNMNLKVTMRSPGSRPDLSSVVDSLIKELQGISSLNELQSELKQLKEKYPWSLLNKGTHEQGDLPELERKDLADLLTLIEKIEAKVCEVKLEVSSV
ncbi:AAA family ATPase [Clostridium sp. CS001]|uniref:AAA family ATPase n=1 Tax=Clostridium sp. CS001 TaxID=2880648 RepID=UPI001CF51475|nr:AAA family ATPase [Clostridium sp. CS001]MCB2289411.1 AAA family ATPase [Clostridium sp. CS001]